MSQSQFYSLIEQESLFSKAYYPLAQKYFSAGLVWSLAGWGSSSTTTSGGGVFFHHHFQGGSSSTTTPGRVLFCHHLWVGVSSTTTSRGVLFCLHFWGGPLPLPLLRGPLLPPLLGGSHVTYPIMLLYTAIEHPGALWAKFTWDPPPPTPNRLTDKHD